MKKVGVAILGLGVVGGGTYKILTEHGAFYRETQGVDVTVECVLEKDKSRALALGVPEEKIASNIAEVVSNPDVTIVVETLDSPQEAKEYVLTALNAGRTVVLSNKELFCKYSEELERAAKRHNTSFCFGASCVGGVPVIRTLIDGLQANDITSFMGIINGATNYILSGMTGGKSYETALKEAQALGLFAADPSTDVEGYDAAYVLSILASLAFHTKVPYTEVFREGIAGINAEDIRYGKEVGYALKLLAIGKRSDAGIEVRVHPAFVKMNHPLASVDGSFNAVFLKGDAVGDFMLYGKGAGGYPTGSAVVSDVLYASTHSENKYYNFPDDETAKFVSDFKSAYYLRITATDKTGVLSKIAAVFGKYNISISELKQEARGVEGQATLIIVTHETHEAAIRNAVEKLNASELAKVETVLRVAV